MVSHSLGHIVNGSPTIYCWTELSNPLASIAAMTFLWMKESEYGLAAVHPINSARGLSDRHLVLSILLNRFVAGWKNKASPPLSSGLSIYIPTASGQVLRSRLSRF